MSSNLKITGFCYSCGRTCKGLFCNDKCKKAMDHKTEKANRPIKGKRAGYGAAGSTS